MYHKSVMDCLQIWVPILDTNNFAIAILCSTLRFQCVIILSISNLHLCPFKVACVVNLKLVFTD